MCSSGQKENKKWCNVVTQSIMQGILRPLLDDSAARNSLNQHNRVRLLNAKKLNVVWHLRTGDICLHCGEVEYFGNIHRFISDVAVFSGIDTSSEIDHIVLTENQNQLQTVLLESFEREGHRYSVYSGDLVVTVRLMLQADILVTTGSGFAQVLSVS